MAVRTAPAKHPRPPDDAVFVERGEELRRLREVPDG
jgi:hypothetical protein